MSKVSKTMIYVITLGAALFAGAALAQGNAVTVTSIADTISGTVTNFAKILSAVSIIAGLGFILASFFKFHQHKLNPTQVPLSQGITLLLIGAGLAVLPVLVKTTTQGVFGTSEVATVTGQQLKTLIGGK